MILLNSGGIDSRVTAAILKSEGHELYSLHITQNKRNEKETREAAKRTAELYCKEHFVFEYPVDWPVKKDLHIEPAFSFLVTHSIGAAYASFKRMSLATGYRNTKDTLSKFEELINLSIYTKPIKIHAPVYSKSFEEIQQIARKLNVPLEDTWSCTSSPKCNKCGVCKKRNMVNL